MQQKIRQKYSMPLSGMRKVIAEHMHRSLAISAQLTIMGEVDASELVRLLDPACYPLSKWLLPSENNLPLSESRSKPQSVR